MPTVQTPSISGLDLIRNPALVQQLIDLLYALRNVNVQLVVGQAAQSMNPSSGTLIGSPPALILPIPLKLSTPISDSTSTAASVSTQLNLLLAALRKTGQLPS